MIEIERKQRIWQELIEEAKNQSETRLEGEFTVMEFAEVSNMGIDGARTFLNKKVKSGLLKIRKTKRPHYYSFVD